MKTIGKIFFAVLLMVGFLAGPATSVLAACDCQCLYTTTHVDGSTVGASSVQPDETSCSTFCKGVDVGEELTPSCTQSSTAPQSCTQDNQCPPGNVCKNSLCTPAECNETKPCALTGQICQGGKCVAAPQTGGGNSAQSGTSILASANPIKATDVRAALGRVIEIFTGLSGTVALIMFIYGGILFLFSGGDEGQVKKALNIFKWSTLGLVVIFTSYAILNQVFSGLEAQFGGGSEGIAYPDIYPLGQISPAVLVGKIIQYALGLVGVAALLVFIWGGFQYFMSLGDAKRAEAGRKTLVYAAIGLIVIFTAFAATTFLINTLNEPSSGASRPDIDVPTPVNPDLEEEDAGPITNPALLACGTCTCFFGQAGTTQDQQGRVNLTGSFQTKTECETRCNLQFTTLYRGAECTPDGSIIQGTGTGPSGSTAACTQSCSCQIHTQGSPGSAGTIAERPQGQKQTVGECETSCRNLVNNDPDSQIVGPGRITLVRSVCQ